MRRGTRATVPRARGGLLLAACLVALSLALFAESAHAGTASVDGISDQSLPTWDAGFQGSSFAGLFARDWVASSHIRYARYVVQWNVMAGGYSPERSLFEHWLVDVAGMGLTPDLGLTSFDDRYPRYPAQYAMRLGEILERARAMGHPLPYVEAWNEPNNQGHRSAAQAAQLANAAQAVCEGGYGCTVVAGDFEDAPGIAAYEREYERNLDAPPAIWGVHPYRSVEAMSEAPYLSFLSGLPDGGAGARVWITEIAARRCTDYGGRLEEHGEAGQARRAEWLLDTLMRNDPPEHAFYYDFLLGGYRRPSCGSEPEDGALYVPTGEPPRVEDSPRAAAEIIWGRARGPCPGAAPDAPGPFGLCLPAPAP